MCSTFASFSPEFYLHHTFLDKIWFTWQQHSSACKKAKFANSHKKMSRFGCQHSQSELIDSLRLPGHIAVVYSDHYYGKHANSITGRPKYDSEEAPHGNKNEDLNDFPYTSPSAETDLRLLEDSDDDDFTDSEGENSSENDFRDNDSFGSEEISSDATEDEGDEEDDEQGALAEEWHSTIGPKEIDVKDIKYGETHYDFWTQEDSPIQSKEQALVMGDISKREMCAEDSPAFLRSDFIPAFKKPCFSSDDFENV